MKRLFVIRATNHAPAGSPDALRVKIPNPTEEDVDRVLDKCQHYDAVMDISDETEGDMTPLMQLWCDDRRYLLLLNVDGDGDDYPHVHSLTNPHPVFDPEAPPGMGLVNGQCFAAADIVTDFDLVRRACREYIRTNGAIPEDMRWPEKPADKQ